jgi:hypothetical protein
MALAVFYNMMAWCKKAQRRLSPTCPSKCPSHQSSSHVPDSDHSEKEEDRRCSMLAAGMQEQAEPLSSLGGKAVSNQRSTWQGACRASRTWGVDLCSDWAEGARGADDGLDGGRRAVRASGTEQG